MPLISIEREKETSWTPRLAQFWVGASGKKSEELVQACICQCGRMPVNQSLKPLLSPVDILFHSTGEHYNTTAKDLTITSTTTHPALCCTYKAVSPFCVAFNSLHLDFPQTLFFLLTLMNISYDIKVHTAISKLLNPTRALNSDQTMCAGKSLWTGPQYIVG